MKFKLSMAKKFWNLDDEDVKTYQELGFAFRIYKSFGEEQFYLENSTSSKEIEFKTIEELLEFGKKHGRLVIGRDQEICIYNDYMEWKIAEKCGNIGNIGNIKVLKTFIFLQTHNLIDYRINEFPFGFILDL